MRHGLMLRDEIRESYMIEIRRWRALALCALTVLACLVALLVIDRVSRGG